MFTEIFNLMRVIYYGVPALIIIIMLIILAVSSRKDKNTQIQKAGDNADQDQKMYIGEEQKQWGFIGASEGENSDTLWFLKCPYCHMFANYPYSECPCCGEPLNGVMIDESESKKDSGEIAQSFEINFVGEADLDEAVDLLHCLCLSHSSCGSDLDESCQLFDPDEGCCRLKGCPGKWDV